MQSQIKVLHLTDLHISYQDTTEAIHARWEKLMEQIQSHEKGELDLVAVTGDITSHGAKEEYQIALMELGLLMKKYQIAKEKVVFCPGNHDADTIEEGSSFYNYEWFINEFYGKQRSRLDEEGEFEVYSINTNQRTSLEFPDHAYIPKADVDKIENERKNCGYKILLMHHQPSVIQNKAALLRLCEKMDLVLCGHLHPSSPVMEKINHATVIDGIAMNPFPNPVLRGALILTITEENQILTENIYI